MLSLFVASLLIVPSSALTVQVGSPVRVEACRPVEISVATSTPKVRAGTRPAFSVTVTNNGHRSARVLDVRNGRRNDLQDTYYELFILQGGRVMDLPAVISDPGPISDADYVVVKPGERVDVRPLSYRRVTERLPPGEYSAFILFWRNPGEAHRSQCRSSEARFVVSK